jgi:hypothetical protein
MSFIVEGGAVSFEDEGQGHDTIVLSPITLMNIDKYKYCSRMLFICTMSMLIRNSNQRF